jgi:twitching motility two-component system response regulator PilH
MFETKRYIRIKEKGEMEKRSILVIDDDLMIRRLLQSILTKAGYSVILAVNGEEGVTQVKTLRPCLVISDVLMPKMDGYEVLRTLKGDDETKDIPVIMLSSMELETDIAKGISLGAAYYLTKPLQRDVLLERIKTILDGKKSS